MKFHSLTSTQSLGFFNATEISMRTGKVDRVSSLLLSLVLLIGLSVVVLGLLFSLRTFVQPPLHVPFPVDPVAMELGLSTQDVENDLDSPTQEEVEKLNEPAADDSLRLVTDVVNGFADSFESIESKMNSHSSGIGSVGKRPHGSQGNGGDIAPRNERWMLKFTARDKRDYARQLDSFRISIGAIGGGISTVDTISNVAREQARISAPSKDFRDVLYFMSANSNVLEQYERQMLQGSGIPVNGRHILKFIPKETEELLAVAEANYYMKNRSENLRVAEIVKTVFECRVKKDSVGFEFVVVDQRYKVQ